MLWIIVKTHDDPFKWPTSVRPTKVVRLIVHLSRVLQHQYHYMLCPPSISCSLILFTEWLGMWKTRYDLKTGLAYEPGLSGRPCPAHGPLSREMMPIHV
jgi:hypothetical protein